MDNTLCVHVPKDGAVHAFLLASYINKGITTLAISDKSLAAHNFLNAKRVVSLMSDRVIDVDLARKWSERLQELIRVIDFDETKSLHIARDLLIEMETRFIQMLSPEIEHVETKSS